MSGRLNFPVAATPSAPSSTRRREDGFFTIWVLGLCMCIMFVGGISFDLWNGFNQRRQMTSLVDAAAVAGASQLDLAAFRSAPPVVKLDSVRSAEAVENYLNFASAQSGIVLTGRQVNITDTRVTVTATTEMDLTLTRIFIPPGKNSILDVTVTGVADPQLGCSPGDTTCAALPGGPNG